MNDIRRTFLWVIFGFSMVLLWDQWQIYNGHKATFFPKPVVATAETPAAPANTSAAANAGDIPSAVPNAAVNPPSGLAQVPGVVAAASPVMPTARERIEVTTDVLKLSFDIEGGSLLRSEFLKFSDLQDEKKHFVLLDESKARVYVAQTGLIGGAFASHKTPMKFSGDRELKEGQNELTFKFESPDLGGLKLIKTYTLTRGSYALKVAHQVLNTGTAAAAPQLYVQLLRDGNKPDGESAFYSTFTGPAVYTDAKKYQKIEFTDI